MSETPMRPQKAPAPAKPTDYDSDVIVWAEEQARLLRAGRFSELDIEHIADEIEDVGKSEKRELASRMVVLLAHLLKWRFQAEKRSGSWRRTIRTQRANIEDAVDETPSLNAMLRDPRWGRRIWNDAVDAAARETGIGDFPEECPWTFDQARDPEFWPE